MQLSVEYAGPMGHETSQSTLATIRRPTTERTKHRAWSLFRCSIVLGLCPDSNSSAKILITDKPDCEIKKKNHGRYRIISTKYEGRCAMKVKCWVRDMYCCVTVKEVQHAGLGYRGPHVELQILESSSTNYNPKADLRILRVQFDARFRWHVHTREIQPNWGGRQSLQLLFFLRSSLTPSTYGLGNHHIHQCSARILHSNFVWFCGLALAS